MVEAVDDLTRAKSINGEVWKLLEQPNRSKDDDARMLHAAHASCYYWLGMGSAVNQQRGEWLISRVNIVLGHAGPALRHARRCMELTEAHRDEMKDFDCAYAHEGLARACALSGEKNEAIEHKEKARALGQRIADAEDKSIFDGDYAAEPWFGIE